MAFRDLIPWNNQGRNIVQRSAYVHPFLAMHREMNRMFDDVFRGFDLAPLSMDRGFGSIGWPNSDVDDTEKEVRITASFPASTRRISSFKSQMACSASPVKRSPRVKTRNVASANV